MSVLESLLAAAHLLSGAAWFGALVYRAFFVEPKAIKFFDGGAQYERFSLVLADGMRQIVMAALLTCGVSGFVLAGLKWQSDTTWLSLMGIKVGIWLVAFAIFAYISWVFWPKRVFATPDEWDRSRRQGFLLAFTMIVLSAAGLFLGQMVTRWA